MIDCHEEIFSVFFYSNFSIFFWQHFVFVFDNFFRLPTRCEEREGGDLCRRDYILVYSPPWRPAPAMGELISYISFTFE